MSILASLYDAVQKRPRPEDVAELILDAIGAHLSPKERAVLDKAAQYSAKRMAFELSSMSADFIRPVSAEKQVTTASKVFAVESLTAVQCMNPETVQDFALKISATISRTYGDMKKLNKEQRHAVGIYKNVHWYNKRWRICKRLEEKIARLTFNNRRYLFTRISKSALATKISMEDFSADLYTACLVAYMSARMSLRSVFTNESQDRAYDEVAEMLLTKCEQSRGTRWDVIAHIIPDERILRHLNEEQKGKLLGAWWTTLTDMATMLEDVSKGISYDRASMIVQRGNDSSTWNQVAGGWNQARAHWISVLYSMNCEALLNTICPGKVMRLMAADVAQWHRSSGGDVHPDTKVWAALPAPWEVMNGTALCNRAIIQAACEQNKVDSSKWVAGKKGLKAVAFKPTPELVHGVAVSSPALATLLRKAGVFSGKETKGDLPNFAVDRDANGFALKAKFTEMEKNETDRH